ncbi:MAG: hypothetical protein WAN60_17730, partial [Candidatus Sulfotelmatobacter sp.]
LAIQHGPFEFALDRGEENIVESGKAHGNVETIPSSQRIRDRSPSRNWFRSAMYWFPHRFGNVKRFALQEP